MEPKYIQVGEQRIAYYESPGKGPAVIFIHGSNLSALTFQPQIESPLGKKFRLIGLDLPGHGMSGPAKNPSETYTLRGFAGIVGAFAEKLQTGKAVYVGFSMGGNILLEASDRLDAYGIMTFGSAPLDRPLALAGKFLIPESRMVSIYNKHQSDEEVDNWTSLCLKPDSEFDRKPLIEDFRRSDGTFREVFAQSALQGDYRDQPEIIKSLPVPFAILHGEKEQLVDKSCYAALTIPTLWRGAVQVIHNAGHLPNLEQPEAFNRLLEDFIGAVL